MTDPNKSTPDFSNLTFDSFRKLAMDNNLSCHEKVGFPNSYREGKEEVIFNDILGKLTSLHGTKKTVLEIGPGCSHLPFMLIDQCEQHGHKLIFIDSPEMLLHLPDRSFIEKHAGRYPHIPGFHEQCLGTIDAVLAYSVIQYVFAEGNLWDILDRLVLLLSDGGEILLGDVPNATMRKRFFSSNAGIRCHHEYTGRDELPEVQFNRPEPGQIDDTVVLAILARVRAAGCHAWVLPQSPALPMANRREDILIRKP